MTKPEYEQGLVMLKPNMTFTQQPLRTAKQVIARAVKTLSYNITRLMFLRFQLHE